mgnify:CR=1 FL=1
MYLDTFTYSTFTEYIETVNNTFICFNHRTYNLGWGHMHCNAIQSDNTIDETLEELKRILKNNNIHTL